MHTNTKFIYTDIYINIWAFLFLIECFVRWGGQFENWRRTGREGEHGMVIWESIYLYICFMFENLCFIQIDSLFFSSLLCNILIRMAGLLEKPKWA